MSCNEILQRINYRDTEAMYKLTEEELEAIKEKRRQRYACMPNEELIAGIEKFAKTS